MAPNVKNPENIVVGDVVYLKSGSTAMTVEEIYNDLALCSWQDKEDKGIEKQYKLTSLTKVKPGNTPLGIYTG